MFVPLKGIEFQQFKDTTLIMSALSVGKVGALALSLFLRNNDAKRIGFFQTDNLSPIVLIDQPYGTEEQHISTGAEFFQFKSYTILHVLATAKHGRRKQFLQEYYEFLSQSNFKQIILLSSLSNLSKHDQQIESTVNQIFYLQSPKSAQYKVEEFVKCEDLLKQVNEQDIHEILEGVGLTNIFIKQENFKVIFSSKYYKQFPVLSLMTYASSGKDIYGGCQVLKALLQILDDNSIKPFKHEFIGFNLKSSTYTIPKYWLD